MEQQEIFNSWINDFKALLFKVIRAYTISDDDASDLFQDISIQVWKSIPGFRGESAVSTWLYRIALNTAIRWSKNEHRRKTSKESLSQEVQFITYQPSENDERLEWLYYQIAQMNEIDKSLTLLLLDGYSYKEMADLVGISESNIGVKIHRIKKYLTDRSKTYQDHGI